MTPIPLRAPVRLSDLAEQHGGELDAELAERWITHLAPAEVAGNAAVLSPLTATRQLSHVGAGDFCCLTSTRLAARVPSGRRWLHENPWWVLAELMKSALPHWQAQAAPQLGTGVVLRNGARLAAETVLGDACRLEENCVVYGGVVLGARVVVGAGAVLGRPGFGFAHGPDGTARRIPQLGGVIIGDDVEIGALCSIDAGTLGPTVIGAGSKLDAQVHIGHNARVGQRCFLAAQVGVAGSVEIGDEVWIGGQAGVADHVRIGGGVRIAAKSGVISDVAPRATVAGFPAVSRWRWLRAAAWLSQPKKGGALG